MHDGDVGQSGPRGVRWGEEAGQTTLLSSRPMDAPQFLFAAAGMSQLEAFNPAWEMGGGGGGPCPRSPDRGGKRGGRRHARAPRALQA